MTDKDNPQDVIESYRKRQQSARRAPLVVIISAVLLVAGAAVLIFWFMGPNRPSIALFSTDTPTPTATFTVTMTPTPTNTPEPTATETPTPTVTITPTVAGPFIYTVVEGDNCFTIAATYKIDLLLLITINNLDPACPIKIGDKLTIPGPDTSLPTATPLPANLARGTIIEHRVQSGDTLGLLAAQYNSTVEAIKEENKITNENQILVGMVLRIPVNLVTPVPSATPTLTPTLTPTRLP